MGAVALILSALALIEGCDREKIGVVRTADLVERYTGMREARSAYEKQRAEWQRAVDTLEADYKRSAAQLEREWESLSKVEQEERAGSLGAQERNLIGYVQSLEERIDGEERRLSEEVLTKVNDAVKRYAEEHGFDIVYGATIEGSILFSEDALDITDELIEALNKGYDSAKETNTTE